VNNFLAPNLVSHTLGHRGRGDYILEGQGRWGRCALYWALRVYCMLPFIGEWRLSTHARTDVHLSHSTTAIRRSESQRRRRLMTRNFVHLKARISPYR